MKRVNVQAVALPALLVCLAQGLASSDAAGQVATSEVGRAIGRIIAAGVVLSSDEFAAGARYDVDDDSESEMKVTHFGYRHQFRKGKDGPIPFAGVSAGQVSVDQRLDLGGPIRDASDFRTRSAGVAGGVRFPLRGGWFVDGGGGLQYSWAESKLDYRSPQSEALAPILDGVVFNWEAEALTTIAMAGVGYHRDLRGGIGFGAGLRALTLHTNPIETDDSVQDVSTDSSYGRLYAVVDIPLGLSIGGLPLRLTPGVEHTFLDADLAEPLDSDKFTELRVGLAALLPHSRHEPPVERLGLSAGYTLADGFHGWSLGVSLSVWAP